METSGYLLGEFRQMQKEKKNLTGGFDILGWLFVGLIIWFLLVNSTHTLRMNDETTTYFIYVGLFVTIITIILVNPIIKKDIDFRRRYKRWKLLAYFTPLPLFIIIISLVIVLPISNMVFPYWLHKVNSHNQQIKFKVSEKREYTVCPGVDNAHKDFKVTGCYDVKDICIENEQFKKYQFCTEILSEKDWENTKKGDDIIIKSKVSYLGMEPISKVQILMQRRQKDKRLYK